MSPQTQFLSQGNYLRVRPWFLAGCVAFLVMLILPGVIRDSHASQRVLLFLAAVAILSGWIMLLVDKPRMTWRTVTAMIASVYLVASLPVFIFEMSQLKWFMRYPHHYLLSMYVRPWVHWGYILIPLGVICSFLGRGRARVAFVTGAALLMVIWVAVGIWVF
jgi:hypothetical protein